MDNTPIDEKVAAEVPPIEAEAEVSVPNADADKCDDNDNDNDNDNVVTLTGETTSVSAIQEAQEDQNLFDKNGQPLSKNALKRLKRKQKWEEYRPIKRQKEREKKKLKRKLGEAPPRKVDSFKMSESQCKVGIVIDLSFDHLMNVKDLGKCMKQVSRSYSINRRLQNPLQFHITSLTGESKEILEKYDGYKNWDVHLHEAPYDGLFEKEKIVYLTSESDNVIDQFENDKFYIIGGLVDHNSQKGLCHKLAVEKGLDHAQLPIGEYIDMKTRKVLTIDQVFDIVANRANGKTWEESLIQVIPQRKNPIPKTNQSS